jgi:hypothetical protein
MLFPYRHVLLIVAATVALFLWSGLSHMMLINGVGYSVLGDDSAIRAAAEGISAGLYAFPAPPGWTDQASQPTLEAWTADFAAGPAGILIVRPQGQPPFETSTLLVAFVAHLTGVALVAVIAHGLGGRRIERFLRLAMIGPIAILAVAMIYWNWYTFPTAFFLAQAVDVVVGWTLVAAILTLVPIAVPHPFSDHHR